MLSKGSRENVTTSSSDACENTHPYSSDSLKNAIFQELREEVKKLKLEMLFLKDELIKDRQRIIALESKKKSHGKEVKKRVDSMILLINDYGGSMTTSSVKAYMGLSKDEHYRTLKCAKEEGLIEVLPDPRDRSGHILNINPDVSKNFKKIMI